MKYQNLIPAMTIVRAGIGLFVILTAVSYLMFAPSWAAHISNQALGKFFIDETTIIHFFGALSMVYGATLLLGLYTRTSALIIFLTQCVVLFFDINNFSLSALALPFSVCVVLIAGADPLSIDVVYLGSDTTSIEKKQPFGSIYIEPLKKARPFSETLNGFLFGVIGFFLLLIAGYAMVFVRSTPILHDLAAVVLEPRALVAQTNPTASAPVATPTASLVVSPVQSTTPSVPKPRVKNEYTLLEVAQHNSAASCYSVVSGTVYDLTPWIPQHPGGSGYILGMCGIDATDAFTGKHGGQARPATELAGFKIGTLTK
jgi:predicted heme/steroid binding protein